MLLSGLLALKKFIVIGAVALLAFLRKLSSGRKGSSPENPEIQTLKLE